MVLDADDAAPARHTVLRNAANPTGYHKLHGKAFGMCWFHWFVSNIVSAHIKCSASTVGHQVFECIQGFR